MQAPPPPPPLLNGADARGNGHAPAPRPSGQRNSDEEQRRREREKRKQHEARKKAAEKKRQEIESNARRAEQRGKSNTNRLKRATPFICDIHFRNDLPQVPCDPKMLVSQLEPAQLAAFKLTSIEREPRRDLALAADLDIPISVLDIGRYQVPDQPQPLEEEDAELLNDEGEAAVQLPSHLRTRERLRGAKAELSWLMHTTYISNEMGGSAAKGISEKQTKTLRDAETAEPVRDDREAQIANIEASFEAARAVPVHQKNPALTPVEILPVLPDFERWPDNYVQISFDNDPTADNARLSKLDPAQRRELAEQAVVKSYSISVGDDDSKVDRFVALMVPAEPLPPREPQGAAGSSSDEARPLYEGQYDWVREYSYSVQNEQSVASHTFVFHFGAGAVRYLDLGTRLVVQKRSKLKDSLQTQRFARPASITIRKRAASEDEEDQRARKLQQLMAQPDLEAIPEEEEPAAEEPAAAGSSEDEDQRPAAHPGRAASPSPSFSDLSD